MDERELGKRLQGARQKAGLTQQELCQKAGLSISTLAKIERGAIKAPSIFTITAIAATVGVSVEELIGTSQVAQSDKKRSKSGVRFVFFDVNGVLVRFFYRAFTKIAEDTGAQPDLIETTFWHYNDEVCRGEITLEEFNSRLAKRLGVDSLKWEDYYFNSIEPIEEMRSVVEWTAKHYRVGLMTNIMPGFLEKMISNGQLPNANYEALIDSSKIGAVKPEVQIYEAAQRLTGLPAEEILLVDDARPNLRAAERAGWRVLSFDDYRPSEGAERVKSALEFE